MTFPTLFRARPEPKARTMGWPCGWLLVPPIPSHGTICLRQPALLTRLPVLRYSPPPLRPLGLPSAEGLKSFHTGSETQNKAAQGCTRLHKPKLFLEGAPDVRQNTCSPERSCPIVPDRISNFSCWP